MTLLSGHRVLALGDMAARPLARYLASLGAEVVAGEIEALADASFLIDSEGLARLAQVAIIGLVIAMGLRAMGIADDIVNLAFAFTFGTVAVALALSFGLGGREAAGKQMEYWLSKLRK